MGVHSGKWAVLNGISTVRNWSINDTQALFKGVASNTGFGTATRQAVEDWTGNFAVFGHTPPVMPGDLISFLGYTAPDNDSSGVGWTYSGQALITQLALTWNWTPGEVLSQAIDFGGHLALTPNAGASQITDTSAADLPLVAVTSIQYSLDNGSTWVNWTTNSGVLQAVLTITTAPQVYVDSSTIVSERIWTGRKKSIFNWTLAVTEHEIDRTRFTKGQQMLLRLFVDSTHYWELKWGKISGFSGIQVNAETGAIIQQNVDVEMNMSDDGIVSSTPGVLGHILKPDTTLWLGV